MEGPRLHSLSVGNFRSINRKIEVRLDAPVVLIHGPNGSGKTSFLSAMELALTGAVPSLERADREYRMQMIHHGTKDGRIVLNVKDVDEISNPLNVIITTNGPSIPIGLSEKSASFFSERCYLAQSLLGQLLTIYQEAGSGSDYRTFMEQIVPSAIAITRRCRPSRWPHT